MSFLSRSPTSLFPTYLLPSLPFHRRKSSSSSTTSSPTTTPSTSPPTGTLTGHTSYIRCGRCAADLCLSSQIISKGFTGRHGRAYLVSASMSAHGHNTTVSPTSDIPPALPNTHVHKVVPRQLVTGAHTVSDVSCAFCGYILGWKYVDAEEESQRYKVGKFILETKKICSAVCWDGDDGGGLKIGEGGKTGVGKLGENEVEFDSQDEEECEDLFAGVWTPSLALKRRRAKRFGWDDGDR